MTDLQRLAEAWQREAADIEADGDFCCAQTRRHDAEQLKAALADRTQAWAALHQLVVKWRREGSQGDSGSFVIDPWNRKAGLLQCADELEATLGAAAPARQSHTHEELGL